MRDVVFVVVTIAFFALCAAYVAGCRRILGADPVAAEGDHDAVRPEVAKP